MTVTPTTGVESGGLSLWAMSLLFSTSNSMYSLEKRRERKGEEREGREREGEGEREEGREVHVHEGLNPHSEKLEKIKKSI